MLNTVIKLFFILIIFIPQVYSQNADPGIGILMSPTSVAKGSTGILMATVGNYGNLTIVSNSLRTTISVGANAEILGIASGSDTRWSQLNLTTGSANTIKLTNTGGSFNSFDVGDILLIVRGNVISNPDSILGNIVYITASNSLLCGGCPSPPLNTSQGNASNSNDNSQTSVAVSISAIDGVNDTGTVVNGLTGGTAFTNVLANDTINGTAVEASQVTTTFISATNPGIKLSGTNVIVATGTPAGSYSLVYQICENVNSTNCDTATVAVAVSVAAIDGMNDTATDVNGLIGGTAFTNVLANDTINGTPIIASQVTTTFVSATNPSITLSGTNVIVAAGTPAGSYSLIYQICENLNSTNCDTATVAVAVSVAAIDGVSDTGTIVNGLIGGTAFTNVLANDTLNGTPIIASQVTTTFISASNPGITLSGTNVIVAAGTPAGSYSLIYQICENLNSTNCDTATVTVTVFRKLTDFTLTIEIDAVIFLPLNPTKDFVVQVAEIRGAPSNGQLVVKIPKQSAFIISYGAATSTSNVSGGVPVNNNDWTITENSLFVTMTSKVGVIIGTNTISAIGFSITLKANVPTQTEQPITATIVNGSGSDGIHNNNTYSTIVKAQ